MTRRDGQNRAGMDEAAAHTRESAKRAARELAQAREMSGRTLSVARLLRQLREENGFSQLFDEALGGSHG